MLTYLFMLMTSWAIVCDVYYLEPTTIKAGTFLLLLLLLLFVEGVLSKLHTNFCSVCLVVLLLVLHEIEGLFNSSMIKLFIYY